MSELPKLIYKFYVVAMKILNEWFMELDRLIIKFIYINKHAKVSRKIHTKQKKMTTQNTYNQIYNKTA